MDYVTQYFDEELMKTISDCTNAFPTSRSRKSIESSTEKFVFLLSFSVHDIDDDVTNEAKADDVFWKVWPVVERVRQGCLKIHRPKCVSIDE